LASASSAGERRESKFNFMSCSQFTVWSSGDGGEAGATPNPRLHRPNAASPCPPVFRRAFAELRFFVGGLRGKAGQNRPAKAETCGADEQKAASGKCRYQPWSVSADSRGIPL
jgi:hypothetical protein